MNLFYRYHTTKHEQECHSVVRKYGVHDAISTGNQPTLHDTDEKQIGSRQNDSTGHGVEHSPELGQWASFFFGADKLSNTRDKILAASVQKSCLNPFAQPFLPESVDHSVPFEFHPEGYLQHSTVAPMYINNGVNDLTNDESGPRRSARLKQKHNMHVGHTRPCKALNHCRHSPVDETDG